MSTEHQLLRKKAKDDHPMSINIELVLLESSDEYSLNLFKTHPRIMEAFEHHQIARNLTSAQLEQLAVRLLHIASYASEHPTDLLAKYNLSRPDVVNAPLQL